MSHMMPLEGALKNLKQEISPERRREYVPRERALELLKQWTGQDFGYDVKKWEAWIAETKKLDEKLDMSGSRDRAEGR